MCRDTNVRKSAFQYDGLHGISRTSVCRLLKPAVPEGCGQLPLEGFENTTPQHAAQAVPKPVG